MKKAVPLIGYYLGWIYPLVVNIYTVLEHFMSIRTKLTGPLDFGNDSIMGYIFYSLVFAALTFFIYFFTYKDDLPHWGILVNLPLYFVSVALVPFYGDDYLIVALVPLLAAIGMIIYTTIVTAKTIKQEYA